MIPVEAIEEKVRGDKIEMKKSLLHMRFDESAVDDIGQTTD